MANICRCRTVLDDGTEGATEGASIALMDNDCMCRLSRWGLQVQTYDVEDYRLDTLSRHLILV